MEAVDGTAAGVALAAAEGDRGAAAEAAGDTSFFLFSDEAAMTFFFSLIFSRFFSIISIKMYVN
jgi:hypothetical protein